ncbi:MAG TPA: hypothetical protein VHH88_02645, partial [Verrucomicrobiae bacterium]|nr:hypothetical protein [Verrucomicrobiae bacterium]
MALAESPWHFWKRRDDDDSRLVWAFVLSLAAHVFVLGTYEGGKELGVWQAMHLPRWLHPPALVAKTNPKLSPPPVEVPLVFVDVNPAQAVAQAPKNAKYYSDKNSRAANPNPAHDTKTAEIDGKQKEMVKTEDVPRSKAFPLNPTVPAPKPEKEEQIEE